MSELQPVPLSADAHRQAYYRYVEYTGGFRVCEVELYADRPLAPGVLRWSVRKAGQGVYRVAIMLAPPALSLVNTVCCESSRDLVAEFARKYGVPVLRIGRVLSTKF